MAQAGSEPERGYVDVHGLRMYFESHGEGGTPLVLIHGAFSATGTSFGKLLPGLSESRRVISLEMQGHGHTADIDRPLRLETMADDIPVALDALGINQADIFGYSMGASIALRTTIRHPDRVRRMVFMGSTFRIDGIQPGLMEGLAQMRPEMMHGTTFYEEYSEIAPRPDDFDRLFEKKIEMDRATTDISDETIRDIGQPVLLVAGDSDLPTLEHMVRFFKLLGGGVFGDTPAGLPRSQLAILPGASHISSASRADILPQMITSFLDREIA
jgi:pimeloyl-ACP methyl ester carboxylesterase